MNNILVIGAGQLGSRHLQGLAKSTDALNITVVEPNASNMEIAVTRFKEINGYNRHVLNMFSAFSEIPDQLIDIAIIATNADIRALVTKQLIARTKVNNIVFEKVAFQSEVQFLEIIELLQAKGIKSWVNCPRRFFPFYQYLKEYLNCKGPLKLEAFGVDWGLACNAVHHIDLLAYLSGEMRYKIEMNNLKNEIYPSKRKNFIEFYGSFSGKSLSGNSFRLSCERKSAENDKSSLMVIIDTPEENIKINETLGKAEFFSKIDHKANHNEELQIMFQSGLTHLQVKQILQEGFSFLPGIEESFEIHKPVLRILKDQYFKVSGDNIDELPIT
jgi:hypothetical protein